MSHVPRNVSFYLLMQDEKAKKVIESGDEEAFKKILFDWGIDTDDHYEIVSCEHRPLENQPLIFNGPMVKGSERLDLDWLNSGYASWEARVEAIDDSAMRADLKEMSRQGCADKTWLNEDTAKAVAKNERNKGM